MPRLLGPVLIVALLVLAWRYVTRLERANRRIESTRAITPEDNPAFRAELERRSLGLQRWEDDLVRREKELEHREAKLRRTFGDLEDPGPSGP